MRLIIFLNTATAIRIYKKCFSEQVSVWVAIMRIFWLANREMSFPKVWRTALRHLFWWDCILGPLLWRHLPSFLKQRSLWPTHCSLSGFLRIQFLLWGKNPGKGGEELNNRMIINKIDQYCFHFKVFHNEGRSHGQTKEKAWQCFALLANLFVFYVIKTDFGFKYLLNIWMQFYERCIDLYNFALHNYRKNISMLSHQSIVSTKTQIAECAGTWLWCKRLVVQIFFANLWFESPEKREEWEIKRRKIQFHFILIHLIDFLSST